MPPAALHPLGREDVEGPADGVDGAIVVGEREGGDQRVDDGGGASLLGQLCRRQRLDVEPDCEMVTTATSGVHMDAALACTWLRSSR